MGTKQEPENFLLEILDVLKVTRLRMQGHNISHYEVDTLIAKIKDITHGQGEGATDPRSACMGKSFCECAALAMKSGANRDTVDGLEKNCPYVDTPTLDSKGVKVESNTAMMERLLRQIPMDEWPKFLRSEDSRISHAAMTCLVYCRPNDIVVDFSKKEEFFKVVIGHKDRMESALVVECAELDKGFIWTIEGLIKMAFNRK